MTLTIQGDFIVMIQFIPTVYLEQVQSLHCISIPAFIKQCVFHYAVFVFGFLMLWFSFSGVKLSPKR
jgi:hypothetical protein